MSSRAIKRSKQLCKQSIYSNDITNLKTYFKELMQPVLEQIKYLNEAVTNLSNIVIKNENKDITNSREYVNTSIACDVSIIGTDIHQLTKNYEAVKEQLCEQKDKIHVVSLQAVKIEKLLSTLIKAENNWKLKRLELCEKMNTVEQLLVCSLACRSSPVCTQETNTVQTTHTSPTIPVTLKPCQVSVAVGLDSKMELITLNNEQDFPNGTWLGNEEEPTFRVRCPISKENLLYINTRCDTAEKMAVMLLDYLFPKDVLSVSNLSGRGKHGKKRLDPLMVYGIKCHLVHHFSISDSQWYKIKQNMDSKCRTAWKKRKLAEDDLQSNCDDSLMNVKTALVNTLQSSLIALDEDVSEDIVTTNSLIQGHVIHTLQGGIEVLHTTPQHILRCHDVQVMNTDHILPMFRTDSDECDPLSNSSSNDKGITIITTDDDSFKTSPMLQILTEDGLDQNDLSDDE